MATVDLAAVVELTTEYDAPYVQRALSLVPGFGKSAGFLTALERSCLISCLAFAAPMVYFTSMRIQ